jgi:hypothetical protein
MWEVARMIERICKNCPNSRKPDFFYALCPAFTTSASFQEREIPYHPGRKP